MEKNEKINLNKPEYFFNRELSWLKFNLRVLREAGVKTTPLLERLKFVAITASNLDEFFMVRVAGLWDQYENGINKRDAAGLTVKAQLEEISKAAHDQMKLLNKYLLSLVKELREAGIYICRVSELSEKGRRWLEAYYQEEIFPVLTPMAVDASRPFPFLANKTLNLAVELTNQEGEDSMGIVQVPSVLPRLLEVPGEEKRSFVFLEDVINEHCSDLYSGCKILDVVPFRITRDADLEFDEDDIDNLLKEVEKSLRKRTRGASVRLEIYNKANSRIRKFLYNNLDITEQEVYEINGPLDATCFFKFASLPGMWPWLYEPFVPQRPLELPDDSDIFKVLRERDVLLHHPYESFDPVVKFVSDAADDPNVLAIKQTLYRVSGNSPIVAALARAAENGKQVTVLVELKARFDEENNIIWARRLEEAGCHVIYGLMGLKTHAKIILVVRKEALEAVKEARAQGDLSENFEYHAAKKDKNQNESRIRYLEKMIKTAKIISTDSAEDEVGMNNTVTVYFEEDDEEEVYKIVTTVRGNSLKNLISNESPLGKALLGHRVGDRVEVRVNDDYSYFVTIRKIENTVDDGTDKLRKF